MVILMSDQTGLNFDKNFRNSWYTPITSNCVPNSFDDMLDLCEELFSENNFEKLFSSKEKLSSDRSIVDEPTALFA